MGLSPQESEKKSAEHIFLPWISNKEKKFSKFTDIFSLRNFWTLMIIKLLLLCWCVALQSAILPESIMAGNLPWLLQCLHLKIIPTMLEKNETFHFEGVRAGKALKKAFTACEVIEALGCTVATPLPSRVLSHGGSAALGRLAAGVPAGIPRERSMEGCASAAAERKHRRKKWGSWNESRQQMMITSEDFVLKWKPSHSPLRCSGRDGLVVHAPLAITSE